ncbi:hypothetical protein ACI8AF_23350 [Blastococcus sp. SYSU D00669]
MIPETASPVGVGGPPDHPDGRLREVRDLPVTLDELLAALP